MRYILVLLAAVLASCGDDLCGTLEGDAEIRNSANVDTFACHTKITGTLMINAPDGFTRCDLPHVVTVGDKLEILNNHDLATFSLAALESVGTTLEISGNDILPNVDGLAALKSIGGDLMIRERPSGGNAKLANLDGLRNLVSLGGNLTIQNNVTLPTCAAEALRDQLQAHGFAGTVTIAGNDDAGTCN